jgi:hypothetical protein
VVSSAQADIRRSETRELLKARIATKDERTNDLLLITCGLPHEHGFVCPLDHFIFRFIQKDLGENGEPSIETTHLSAVALHLWGTDEWVEIHRANAVAVPWTAA